MVTAREGNGVDFKGKSVLEGPWRSASRGLTGGVEGLLVWGSLGAIRRPLGEVKGFLGDLSV